ncbi:hypothetical protein M758_UG265500 [Ceratodon purpureus]|nr:hypothetical protein M758_UG265500 [Ceratodon purpureus]
MHRFEARKLTSTRLRSPFRLNQFSHLQVVSMNFHFHSVSLPLSDRLLRRRVPYCNQILGFHGPSVGQQGNSRNLSNSALRFLLWRLRSTYLYCVRLLPVASNTSAGETLLHIVSNVGSVCSS